MWKFKMISRLEEEQECARFPSMRKRGMFRVDYSQMPRMSQHRWLVTERDSKGIQSLVSPNRGKCAKIATFKTALRKNNIKCAISYSSDLFN